MNRIAFLTVSFLLFSYACTMQTDSDDANKVGKRLQCVESLQVKNSSVVVSIDPHCLSAGLHAGLYDANSKPLAGKILHVGDSIGISEEHSGQGYMLVAISGRVMKFRHRGTYTFPGSDKQEKRDKIIEVLPY